jgi:predicted flap endonuclease-1-like 5' DNA nuclease
VETAPVSELQKSGDLSSLRSVRSEALRPIGASPFASRVGEAHDLKRIRGIGVLIEKKLNQMGVMTYEQIAEWTVADIERVSHVLDFKGRIERENWVEQARILASGGQTEFSRRADRGENTGM